MLPLLLLACAGVPDIQSGPAAPDDRGGSAGPGLARADWTVDCNGGGDFTTINAAIEASSDNEWIEVAPCTYRETVDFQGKTLWISSSDGPDDTIIDANNGYGVQAALGEGDGTALVGFTIEKGRGTYGSVYVSLSALRLEDVVIRDSRGGYAVIYGASADLELKDVTIEDSAATSAPLYLWRGAFIIDGVTADCERAQSAMVTGHGSFFLDHGNLTCPSGYAIYNENSVGRIHRSVLDGGFIATTDPDHYTDNNQFENTVVKGNISQTYGTLTFRNSILDGGSITGADLYELRLEASVFMNSRCAFTNSWSGEDTTVDPTSTFEFNDFYDLVSANCDGTNYTGQDGNIDEDPRFTDAPGGDYSTLGSSPLIDAGLEDDVYDDPDGTRNDIGIYGGPRSVGGGW